MSMKAKVITVINNSERNITDRLEAWIASESPIEIVSMTQSSCDVNGYVVTLTILYRKESEQQG